MSRSALAPTAALASFALLAWLWLGPAGLILAAVAAGLTLVWKYDNWSGSCFLLAILGLIAVAVPMLLLALLALRR